MLITQNSNGQLLSASADVMVGVTNLADMVFVIGGTNSTDDLTTIVLMQENT
jgi:hypothetical protein